MKLVRFQGPDGGGPRVGALIDGGVVALPYASVVEAMSADGGVDLDGSDPVALDAVQLLAPIPNPGKVVCVGLNYLDHAAETEMEVPAVPLLFAKFPSSIVGPQDPIELTSLTSQLDYEAELAAVVGTEARDVPAAEALDVIGGYMNLNDISARDVQLGEGGQWTRGKSFDTYAPTGPFLLTADELPDPQALRIECLVNGQAVQSASTSDMIFGVADLIAFISRGMTLHPGDLIATGTPPGVGMGRKPPLFLGDGDRVAVEVSGLGRLENPVRAVA